ncbi:polar amino acid transport system permease protein [Polymorphobacter multimanifer]|uniref:Polar amino acid transport system permease protein n=3 Tax=Polymorphobacter multimanifer TaxID=1070431 RepID=A0A841LD95_9SPHN|nr:amino acid ABC transporter permease [Polymorphobacter multimanifer]MBB6227785.1 polar amino acid transport system permease protein [Polymorphobacter multimanifer]
MIERIVAEAPAFFSSANLGFVLAALGRTLFMTFVGCGLGFGIGLGLAVLRRTQAPMLAPARWLAMLWVETFRRIPFLVILIMVLFGVQPLVPEISLIGIATIAVTLVATAFLSEIIRAGLESVPRAQVEGAAAMNFSAWQSFWLVVLPQSWRVILPPAAAFMVMFIKDTSLASHLGVVELTFSGKILVNRGSSPVLGYGIVLLGYFILSWPLGRLARMLEVRLAPSRNQ